MLNPRTLIQAFVGIAAVLLIVQFLGIFDIGETLGSPGRVIYSACVLLGMIYLGRTRS